VLAGKTASSSDVDEIEWKGDLIVTGTDDGFVRLWNSTTGQLVFEKAAASGVGIAGVTFDPAGHAITATTYEGVIQTWSLEGQLLASEQDPTIPWHVVFDPTGKRALRLSSKRSIEVYDVATKTRQLQLLGHLGHVTDAAWSPHADIFVTTALDGTIRFWDATNGSPLQVIQHPGRQSWVDFAPDGRFLAAEDDGFAIVGELPTYRGTAAAFEKLLRCRVPFVVRNDQIQLRGPIDRKDCDEQR